MKVSRILVTGLVALLAACAKKEDAPKAAAATPTAPPVLTVNGKPISQKVFEAYAEGLARQPFAEISAEDKEQIKENLVRVVLFAEESEKNGLLKDPDVAASLEVARLQLIQQAVAQKFAKEHVATEAELRAEYDAQMAAMPLVEYRARHILVSGEEVAQKVIARLKAGKDFAELAKQLSIHKESARNGGDLGWFSPAVMDPEFANAVALLKKGEITETPVRSRFGWHVVQLLETRDRTAPAFEAVKDRLSKMVVTKKLTKQSDDMLKLAKVEPALTTKPPVADAPAPAAPAPAAAPSAPPPGN